MTVSPPFVLVTILGSTQKTFVNVKNVTYFSFDNVVSPSFIEIYFDFQDQSGGAYALKVEYNTTVLGALGITL